MTPSQPAPATFTIFGYPKKPAFGTLAEAAQEAEFTHVENGGFTVRVQEQRRARRFLIDFIDRRSPRA